MKQTNVIEMTEKMISTGAADVLCERYIQTVKYSKEHDAQWVEEAQLIEAAMCYATTALEYEPEKRPTPLSWPWTEEAWKPEERRRDLVKAAALLIAEIDRIDEAEKRSNERR